MKPKSRKTKGEGRPTGKTPAGNSGSHVAKVWVHVTVECPHCRKMVRASLGRGGVMKGARQLLKKCPNDECAQGKEDPGLLVAGKCFECGGNPIWNPDHSGWKCLNPGCSVSAVVPEPSDGKCPLCRGDLV